MSASTARWRWLRSCLGRGDRATARLRSARLRGRPGRPVPQPVEALLRRPHLRQPAQRRGLSPAQALRDARSTRREWPTSRSSVIPRCRLVEAWARLTDWERHGDFIPLHQRHADWRDPRRCRRGVRRAYVEWGRFISTTRWKSRTGSRRSMTSPASAGSPSAAGRHRLGGADGLPSTATVPPSTGTRTQAFALAAICSNWPNRVAGRRVFGKLVDGLLDDSPT